MSLIQLPPEILTMVLLNEAIPPHQRIRLRRVAKNWQELIEGGLEKQKKLVIYGTRKYRPPARDHLVIAESKFRVEFIQQLKRLIPSLTELTVKTFSYASYQQLPALLESYQNTLTSVTLTGHYYGKENANHLFGIATSRLITALNTLTNLSTLQLSGHCLNAMLLYDLIPTLARLERFDLEYPPNHVFFSGPIFTGLSSRCTHLQLPATITYWERCNLADSLTHLVIVADEYVNCYNPRNPEGLSEKSVNCISQLNALRYLSVSFKYPSPLNTARLHQLAQLQRPAELELKLLGMSFNPAQFGSPGTERPLINVKQLTIGIVHGRIDEAAVCHLWRNIAAWFPQLQHLTIQCLRMDYFIFKEVLEGLSTSCAVNVEQVGRG